MVISAAKMTQEGRLEIPTLSGDSCTNKQCFYFINSSNYLTNTQNILIKSKKWQKHNKHIATDHFPPYKSYRHCVRAISVFAGKIVTVHLACLFWKDKRYNLLANLKNSSFLWLINHNVIQNSLKYHNIDSSHIKLGGFNCIIVMIMVM